MVITLTLINVINIKSQLVKVNIIIFCIVTITGISYELIRYVKSCSKNELKIKRTIYDPDDQTIEIKFKKFIKNKLKQNVFIMSKGNTKMNLFENIENIYNFLERWNLNLSKKEKGNLVGINIKNIDKKYAYLILSLKKIIKIYPEETITLLFRKDNINFEIIKIRKASQKEVIDRY